MDATANTQVSWSTPTLTQPVLRVRSWIAYGIACSTSGPVKKQVVVFHLDRLTLGVPLPPGHGQPTELFALLGVDADHRLAVGLMGFDLLVEVAELGIPVGVLGAFEGLDVGPQAEPFPLQQPAHRRGRDPMPLPGQLLGQVPQ